jgi:16S rRNA (cytosine967-C5)-methyltransferase
MREENQLRIILNIIEEYKLDEPLARYLKKYFRQHPNMGSKDRSYASFFVYNYFRLGNALKDMHSIERLIVGSFLSSDKSNPILKYCLDNFSDLREHDLHLPLKKKEALVREMAPTFRVEDIVPYAELLSPYIDYTQYAESYFHRPQLWIRVRRNKKHLLESELNHHGIAYKKNGQNPYAFSFNNSTSLTNLPSFEKGDFEIQDWASQQTMKYIPVKENDYWWDACAGSGGKSLMLFDAEPSVKILATDSRDSIIENLKERFSKVGLTNYTAAVLDLTKDISNPGIDLNNLSGIIADVPCSGSGTWARTPEWLSMFDSKLLRYYQSLQRKIIENLVAFLPSGKPLVYITCSVFESENEENVKSFTKELPLELEESAYLNGIAHGADTMYVARLIKK